MTDFFSLTAAMEAINVELDEGYPQNSMAEGRGLQKTTDMHYYIGGKIGGLAGAALLAMSVVVAASMVSVSFGQ